MSITIKHGNILDATEEIIAQQCCCTALRPHGLSDTIAKAFPYGDAYAKRRPQPDKPRVNCARKEDRPTPGTIEILTPDDPSDGPKIVCLYAQYAMGKPGKYYTGHGIPDTHTNRAVYFATALQALADTCPTSVAFPYKIGCGLAGGNWALYESMLKTFATENPDIDVAIYRIE